ncbi:MAG: hypothetical protein K8H86_13445 [Ignavibacteriaceae bacterium]|nr:hypothetical protein [Ignavibacteriaceae bacterium]
MNSVSFTQEIKEGEEIVDEYFLTLEKYKDVIIFSEAVNDVQLMEIAKNIYAVYQKFPQSTYERMWAYYDINKNDKDTIDYPGIKHMALLEIGKRFGEEYYNILEFPYTFEIKILDLKLVEYLWDYKKYKTIITAQIEFVLGGEKFNAGDIIEFDCYKDKIRDFEKNKSYLVRLKYSYTQEWKLGGLFLQQKGLEIIDGFLIDIELEQLNKPAVRIEDLENRYKKAINNLRGELN